MGWFKKTSYPEFWNSYSQLFSQKQEIDLNKIRFVIFDTETTGLNPQIDRILSIGCIGVSDLKIKVADQLEHYLLQDKFNTDTVKIHGLLKKPTDSKIAEKEAIISFLSFINDAVIVAHHAAFDIAMINQALKRLGLPKLKNRVLDTGHLYLKTQRQSIKTHFSLDELSKDFNIPQHDRHTASGDAYITAMLFIKLVKVLTRNRNLSLKDLERRPTRIGLL